MSNYQNKPLSTPSELTSLRNQPAPLIYGLDMLKSNQGTEASSLEYDENEEGYYDENYDDDDDVDYDSDFRVGENGSKEYTVNGVQDPRVAMFFSLTEGVTDSQIEEFMNNIFKLANKSDSTEAADPMLIHDLFILTLQTRDCRGGKGGREMFYNMFIQLYKQYPATTLALLPLIPEYGYFKDYYRILDTIVPYEANLTDKAGQVDNYFSHRLRYNENKWDRKGTYKFHQPKVILPPEDQQKFIDAISTIIAKQLLKDEIIYNDYLLRYNLPRGSVYNLTKRDRQVSDSDKLSLCAKWAPRPDSCYASDHLLPAFDKLTHTVVPHAHNDVSARIRYNNLVTTLTKAMDTPEVKMCSGRWDEIDFKRVPSRALSLYRKAFLNEDWDKYMDDDNAEENRTGNRHPENEGRVRCREKLRAALSGENKGITGGKQLFPHDVVTNILTAGRSSAAEQELYQVQWEDIRNDTLKRMAEWKLKLQQKEPEVKDKNDTEGKTKIPPVDLGKLVPLVDVSASMGGKPMMAAIALGMLVSEVNHPAFRDRVLTFESSPNWVDLSNCPTITAKAKKIQAAGWGGSTNVEAAFMQILKVVKEKELPIEEVPNLIVFSDMQFDQAVGGNSKTQLEHINQYFHDAGMAIHGIPYPPPGIVFWNLRGETEGYPATANEENVQMLSGFSGSLFKYILQGKAVPAPPTPYQTLRRIIDDDRYDAIRVVLSDSREGALANYSFTPAAQSECHKVKHAGSPLTAAYLAEQKELHASAAKSTGWLHRSIGLGRRDSLTDIGKYRSKWFKLVDWVVAVSAAAGGGGGKGETWNMTTVAPAVVKSFATDIAVPKVQACVRVVKRGVGRLFAPLVLSLADSGIRKLNEIKAAGGGVDNTLTTGTRVKPSRYGSYSPHNGRNNNHRGYDVAPPNAKESMIRGGIRMFRRMKRLVA